MNNLERQLDLTSQTPIFEPRDLLPKSLFDELNLKGFDDHINDSDQTSTSNSSLSSPKLPVQNMPQAEGTYEMQTLPAAIDNDILKIEKTREGHSLKLKEDTADLETAIKTDQDRHEALHGELLCVTKQYFDNLTERECTWIKEKKELTPMINTHPTVERNIQKSHDHLVPFQFEIFNHSTPLLNALLKLGINEAILSGIIPDLPLLPYETPLHERQPKIVVWSQSSALPIRYFGGQDAILPDKSVLHKLWGAACDRDFNILVTDRGNHRVLVFREDGTLFHTFGRQGSEAGQFCRPAGITVDAWNRIVVVDKDNNRVQIFTLANGFLLTFGSRGAAPGKFNCPWDVSTNSFCQIVVSDYMNHRIQLFSPYGAILKTFGGCKSDGSFWFGTARGVSFCPDGSIVVTDMKAHDIIKVNRNLTTAQSFPTKCGELRRPQGIAVDDEGNVIVSDSKNFSIKVFNKFGVYLKEFGPFVGKKPMGISLLPNSQVAFVDAIEDRIYIV